MKIQTWLQFLLVGKEGVKWEATAVPLVPKESQQSQGQLEKSQISICRVDPEFLTTPRLLC